jgi:hypothetical protein
VPAGVDNFLNTTGDTSTGMQIFSTALTNNDDWLNSPISIRERGLVGAGTGADNQSPNLNFHWSTRQSRSLWFGADGRLNWGDYSVAGIPAADGIFRTGSFQSTVATGTSPFTVTSTTRVSNLNVATAGTADILTTGRTIGIGTGAVGTATSFNGSANITIPITGVSESYLTWGGKHLSGQVTPIGMSLSNELSANRIAFINGAGLDFEYSADSGTTWTNYNYTATQKSQWCTTGLGVPVGRISGEYFTTSRTRFTLTAQNGTTGYVYTNPRKMLINIASSGGMDVLVETRTGVNFQSSGAWSTVGTYSLSGWSGWNDIPLVLGTLGGGTTQTGNNWQLRLTFIMTSKNATYPTTANVEAIRIFGENAWQVPSTLAGTNDLYSFDMSQNAFFPGTIQGTRLISTIATGTSPLAVTSTTAVTNLNADLLDGLHATAFVSARTISDWNNATSVIGNVIGALAWKNYGNGHTIFDASNSTAPNGVAKNNTNPDVFWSATYPTLMGWNGTNTYGVRVDSARVSDSTTGNAATATTLQTARTINGVSFNGSANITVTAAPNAHTHAISDVTNLQTSLDAKINTSARNAANGVAPLDATSKVPVANLPDFITGAGRGFYLVGTISGAVSLSAASTGLVAQLIALSGGDYENMYGYMWTAAAEVTLTWTDQTTLGPTFQYHVLTPGDEGDSISPVTLEAGDMIVFTKYSDVAGDGNDQQFTFSVINSSDPRFANYLPLSGGTLTGSITSHRSDGQVHNRWALVSEPSNYYLDLNTVVTASNVRWNFNQRNAGTNYDNVLVIDTGKIGIGTNNPASLLEINSTVDKASVRVTEGNHNSSSSTFLYPALSYYARRDNVRRISNPLVDGLGTTSDSGGASASIVFSDRPGTSSFPNAVRNSDILFYTAENILSSVLGYYPRERMRIDATGKVGIGTNSPGYKLSIEDIADVNLYINKTTAAWVGYGTGTHSMQIVAPNMGNTSNLAAFEFGKAFSARNSAHIDYIHRGDGSTSNYLSLGLHSVNEILNITGASNVGIGTTTPGEKLEVVGNTKATTFISTQATGTAPLTVASTTAVTNLNADLLDGNHAAAFALASHTHAISDVTGLQTAIDARIPLTQKGAASGVVPLNSSSKIEETYLPNFIFGGMRYIGSISGNTTAESLLDSAQTYIASNGGRVSGCYFIVSGTGTGTGTVIITGGVDTNNGVTHTFTSGPFNMTAEEGDNDFNTIDLEPGDWFVINDTWGPYFSVTYQRWSVVNNTYALVTTTAPGIMSAADKTKLDGIAASANNYSHPTDGANSTISNANGLVLSSITVNTLGHVTAVGSKTLAAADIPTLNQSTTGSAATLTTARTLTIGSTGKTFNGSADVSWSLADIGAAATSHTHTVSNISDRGNIGNNLMLLQNTTAATRFVKLNPDHTVTLESDSTFKTSLGLSNVTNESKATMFASPTFTGTVSGVTAAMVGAAATSHTHGNITSAGAIGSTSLLAVVTGTGGVLETRTLNDSSSAAALGTGTGLTTERDVYYGTPTINNSKTYTSSTTIYAPTAGGTENYVLFGATTTTAPIWDRPHTTLVTGTAMTNDTYITAFTFTNYRYIKVQMFLTATNTTKRNELLIDTQDTKQLSATNGGTTFWRMMWNDGTSSWADTVTIQRVSATTMNFKILSGQNFTCRVTGFRGAA